MGKLTVDLKHMKLFVTMDKLNANLYMLVMQGKDHIRPRPDGNGRHSDAVPIDRDGAEGYSGSNFLGTEWAKKKGFKPGNIWGDYTDYPSLNEIFIGLMKEAALQITNDSGCPEGSQLLQEAMDNICATWEQLLELVAPKNPTYF
jgi:hypothetical protein